MRGTLKATIERGKLLPNSVTSQSVWIGEQVSIYVYEIEDFFKIFKCCNSCLVKSMCIDIDENPPLGPYGEKETSGRKKFFITNTCEKFALIRRKVKKQFGIT